MVLVFGCAAPTEPKLQHVVLPSSEVAQVLADVCIDARDRLLPNLENRTVAAALSSAMDRLQSALASRDDVAAAGAIGAAETALETYRQLPGADTEADFAIIDYTVSYARSLLPAA